MRAILAGDSRPRLDLNGAWVCAEPLLVLPGQKLKGADILKGLSNPFRREMLD